MEDQDGREKIGRTNEGLDKSKSLGERKKEGKEDKLKREKGNWSGDYSSMVERSFVV
jgi:hypothetical protein